MIDLASVLMILKIVSAGVGVAKEIADLATKVLNGEEITDEEIKLAQDAVKNSVARWNEAQKKE